MWKQTVKASTCAGGSSGAVLLHSHQKNLKPEGEDKLVKSSAFQRDCCVELTLSPDFRKTNVGMQEML